MADTIPRVIDAAERDLLSRGVRQRIRVLEAFLADVYGPGRAFDDGVVPWRLVYTSGKFRREVAGVTPPSGVRCHVSVIDLVRDEQGKFRVLGATAGVPSGISDVIENQFAPSRLLSALRAAAPHGVTDPFVVVLTPGVRDAAWFEHTLLARLMGVELVEGRDLFCWRNRVYAHTTRGWQPVDVVYRGVDDDWLDPMQFHPESSLGCPGLVNAARAGNVTIANAIGNDVAGDTLIRAYTPDLIRYYLGEEPLLENVESGLLGERDTPAKEKRAPRHIDLRLFAVNDGSDVWVPPGAPAACERDGRT